MVNDRLAAELNDQALEDVVYVRLSDYFRKLHGHRAEDLYDVIMPQLERPLIKLAIEACNGNKCEAARMLGINRNTLLKKMRHLGMATQPRFWRKKGRCRAEA